MYITCCVHDRYFHNCSSPFPPTHTHTHTHTHTTVRLEPVNPITRTFNDSQYVSLGCDMAGYIHPDDDLFWLLDGQPVLYTTNNSSKYSISYSDGVHLAQFGGDSTVPSRVSWLTVFDVQLDDADNQYVCAIKNTEHRVNVALEVQEASSELLSLLLLV